MATSLKVKCPWNEKYISLRDYEENSYLHTKWEEERGSTGLENGFWQIPVQAFWASYGPWILISLKRICKRILFCKRIWYPPNQCGWLISVDDTWNIQAKMKHRLATQERQIFCCIHWVGFNMQMSYWVVSWDKEVHNSFIKRLGS